MTEYQTGHIRRNQETGEVALRTIFPSQMAWLIGTINTGARNGKTEEVEGMGWEDVYVPATQ